MSVRLCELGYTCSKKKHKPWNKVLNLLKINIKSLKSLFKFEHMSYPPNVVSICCLWEGKCKLGQIYRYQK